MHEYAVTKNLVETVTEEALKNGASKVISINIVIGDLSTVLDESIQMYFDFFTEGTVAHGATLNFIRVPAQFYCEKCEKDYNKPKSGFECPTCAQTGRLLDKGKDFYIESIDVE